MAENININYINKDFSEYKLSLAEFAKTYFPSTYSDFTPSSPGTMFLEMSAYICFIFLPWQPNPRKFYTIYSPTR